MSRMLALVCAFVLSAGMAMLQPAMLQPAMAQQPAAPAAPPAAPAAAPAPRPVYGPAREVRSVDEAVDAVAGTIG